MANGFKSKFSAGGFIGLFLRILAVSATIAGITYFYFNVIHVNATTIALSYLLAVLICAARWGLVESITASVLAVLCFNFFFLPPVITFTVADPQNWVALFAFLAASIIASQLSARGKRRTQEALARQSEMEKLYAVSRAILLIDPSQNVGKQMAKQIAETFDLRAVALLDRAKREISRAGPEDLAEIDDKLREAAIQGTSFEDAKERTMVTAIRLGGEPIGSLAISGTLLSDTALQALCNLVAVGLEKTRAEQVASQAEAARQSQEFKSTLLDAIAHEFNTPLATIKTATTSIISEIVENPGDLKDLLRVVDEEADRLERVVADALQLARVDAGRVQLNLEPHSIDQIVHSLCEEMRSMTEGRSVALVLADGLPLVRIDGELIKLAIRQLIDNALKYSSPPAPVEISNRSDGEGLVISVGDRGPGIPEPERARIFEKFYRLADDRSRVPGTGMGLAIARQIVEAHGGHMSVESREGGGSIFSIFIPFNPKGVSR